MGWFSTGRTDDERKRTNAVVDEATVQLRVLTRELERAVERLETAIDRMENGHE